MAARATDGRLFPSGPEPIKYSKPRAPRQAEPVMSYPEDVSPYGAYDMAGNVWEWTKDWYDSKYYRQLFGQPIDNPTGPSVKPRSLQLVVKGGAKNGSASFREGMALDKRLSYIGFRCVLPVQEQAGLVNPVPGAPGPSQPAPAPGQPTNPPAAQSQSVPVPF
jgi:formylglycine-generating enzyme required for sulfatase activity